MPAAVSTTPFSMSTSVWSTAGLSTRHRSTLGAGSPEMRLTTCGCTMTPPFAIPEYIAAICKGVTAMPCPIGMLPIDEEYHLSGGSSAGFAS